MPTEQHDTPLSICVVEDEADLREEIVESLQMAGFQVRGFEESCALYAALLLNPCDIVVLDVGLPGEDGFSITERLHALGSIGIIMLTARSQNEDRVHGLKQGADAYLVKPTDLRVLEATIISLARRLKKGGDDAASVSSPPAENPWELSANGWLLLDPSGKPLSLTPQENTFLGCVMEHAGVVVSREALVTALGKNPDEYNFHCLDALVNRLRKKASDLGINLPLRAVRGAGYLFTGK